MRVHMAHHLFHRMRACNGQNGRMGLGHQIAALCARTCAQAPSNNHLAILSKRLANGVKRLLDRIVDEPAGVHDHQIGILIGACHRIALGAQLRDDALRVHQCLGAA